MSCFINRVWQYRNFILSSIKMEFRAKFARSRLGGAWMILHPLSQVIIFTFILSAVLSAKLPNIDNRYAYAIYLMSGTLGWSLFSEIVNRCLTIFIDNGNLLKKVAFPKIALPLIVTGTALINNVLLSFVILLIFGLLGHLPNIVLFWLPLITLINLILAVSFGLILGILNVFMRDIGQIVPVMMQFLFWFTPIVYMVDIIPAQYHAWLFLNPLASIISAYQDVLLFQKMPALLGLTLTAVFATALCLFTVKLFQKAQVELVDQL